MNSLIKRTCEGAYFTHSCNRRVTAASQQLLFRPAISSVTGEVDVASCAALLCMCAMLIGSQVGKAEPGNPRPALRERNFDLWWWVTQTCLYMRSLSADCVWKWPRGFSQSDWGVKKFSDVADEVGNTQTIFAKLYSWASLLRWRIHPLYGGRRTE